MILAVDTGEDLFGVSSSCRGRGRLKKSLNKRSILFERTIYRCLRRGVDRSSSTIVDVSGEIGSAGEAAEVNDNERIVDGVEDVVESIELRSCCVDESEIVSRDNFLLISEFCSLAMYTARKQKSIDEHNSSASCRSFNKKTINSTVDDLSFFDTKSVNIDRQ